MPKYITTSHLGSEVNVNIDLIIMANGYPLVISAIDIPQRVRKLCSDLVSVNNVANVVLKDRDDLNFKKVFSMWNQSYRFRFDKMDNGCLHGFILNRTQDYLVDWDHVGLSKLVSSHLRNKEYLPVNENIVNMMFEYQNKNKYGSKWIIELDVYNSNPQFDNLKAYVIDVSRFKGLLKEVKTYEFSSNFDWNQVEDVTDYVFTFLDGIKNRLKENITTLYNPKNISEYINCGIVKLYDGQIPTTQAAIEVLKKDKTVYINAQQGFGKSPLSVKVVNSLMKEKNKVGYNCFIVAPTITVKQWRDEILNGLDIEPDIFIITSGVDFIRYYEPKPSKPTYYIVGKEAFKLDSKKSPAVNYKTSKINRKTIETWGWNQSYKRTVNKDEIIRTAVCPDCGMPLKNVNRTTEDVFLNESDFDKPKKSNLKCSECGAMLWQSTYNKTSKTSVINYIKTKKIKFDIIICDEAHESNNQDSLIGTALRTLLKEHCKKAILLSGTSNNGYASSFHNVLMGISPKKLVDDNCLDVKEFVKRYGTLQATTKVKDGDYRRSGRNHVSDDDFIEIEGINPVCFFKYLSKNFIFANLSDLKKDLPNLSEEFVPVVADEDLANYSSNLEDDIKKISAFNYKKYEDSIIKHYINNPYGWLNIPITVGEETHLIQPRNMADYVGEKENKLIEICKKEKSENRPVWVYTDFSGEGGQYMQSDTIPERLKKILELSGLKVFVLKASVKNIDRKEVIEKNISKYDVFISNPLLINVGINLQAIPTYIFLMPSYRVNVVNQAKSRGFRANSTLDNRIYHLYYTNTIEKGICERYQRKSLESKAIEGKFDVITENESFRTSSAFGKKIDSNMH